MVRLLIVPALVLLPAITAAQTFEKFCLPENDAGTGLSLAVDAVNDLHLTRVFRVLGNLNHTVIPPGVEARNEQIAAFVSRLGFDEVETTDLAIVDGLPRVCFYNGGAGTFEVALLGPNGWQREVVMMAEGAGRWCTLLQHDAQLTTVFGSDDGVLRIARRDGPDDWSVSVVDDPEDLVVGRQVSVAVVAGRLVAAHQTGRDRLRVSWQQANGWLHEDVEDVPLPAGVGPVATDSGAGQLWVAHGVVSPPGTSDGGMLLTSGVRGALETVFVDRDETGGSIGGLRIGRRFEVTTRLFRRNAVFGNSDGLRYFDNLLQDPAPIRLENFSAAQQRHTFLNIQMAEDAFGLPVIALLDSAAPFVDDRGSGLVCIWRPLDTDRDRIPDDAENRFGTDPMRADTDDDGRSDGDEVLIDQTNPNGDGPLVPVEVDLGVVDASPPDAGVTVDAGPADAGADGAADAGRDVGAPDADAVRDAAADAAADGAVDMRAADGAPPARDGLADVRVADAADVPPDGSTSGGGSDGCRTSDAPAGGGLALLGLLLAIRRGVKRA